MIQTLIIFLTISLTLISAIYDSITKKIRNEIFIVGILSGFLLNCIETGVNGLFSSFCGMLIPMTLFLPFCTNRISFMGFRSIKIMGMGDLKLFGFTGALVGIEAIFKILFLTYIFGGVFSLVFMIRKGILVERLKYFFSWLTSAAFLRGNTEYISTEKIQFAPFMFCGVFAYYLIRRF